MTTSRFRHPLKRDEPALRRPDFPAHLSQRLPQKIARYVRPPPGSATGSPARVTFADAPGPHGTVLPRHGDGPPHHPANGAERDGPPQPHSECRPSPASAVQRVTQRPRRTTALPP